MIELDRDRTLPLGDLVPTSVTAGLLAEGGLSPEAAGLQSEIIAKCALELLRVGERPETPARAFHVPGRIEVLGKHTDYCGGRSLLAATERGFAFVAVPRRDGVIGIADVLRGERDLFPVRPDLEVERGHWSAYPRTVARRLARNFPGRFGGARIAFGSSLPPAAGLSTSSAFMVGVFIVLAELEGLGGREELRAHLPDAESLAAYLAAVENGASFGPLAGDSGVGTEGGSEDHTAILACRPGELAVYSFAPVRLERSVRSPAGHVFVVGASGVSAEKTGDALDLYNRASRLARGVVEAYNAATGAGVPHIAAMLAGPPAEHHDLSTLIEGARHPEFPTKELLTRLQHFEQESDRIIPAAVRCLEAGDWAGFGAAVDSSQELGARLLKNQVPETEHLARDARRLGAAAASAFGAGFGGSVWALVREEDSGDFLEGWSSAYRQAFPARADAATFFITRAAPAAFAL